MDLSYSEKLKEARKWARSEGGVLKEERHTINGRKVYYVTNTDHENLTIDAIIKKAFF